MTLEGIIKTSKLSRYYWRYHRYPGDHRNARSWRNGRVRYLSFFEPYDFLYVNFCGCQLYVRRIPRSYWRYQLVCGPGGPFERQYYRTDNGCIICATSIRVGSIGKCSQTIPSTCNRQNQWNSIMAICTMNICN